MSLPESGHQWLFAAGNEFPDLLPKDDPMAIFAERKSFPASRIRSSRNATRKTVGRRSLHPSWRVIVLQFREHMSGTEAAQTVIRRL